MLRIILRGAKEKADLHLLLRHTRMSEAGLESAESSRRKARRKGGGNEESRARRLPVMEMTTDKERTGRG